LLSCAALLAAAVVAVVPETLPNLWAGVKERPESPALVSAFWLVATAISITGKCALSSGVLSWRASAAAHIAGTVSNRIVPAGFGAGGAYLIALRKGGMALPAASAMVILWAGASGVAHATGVLIGGLWLHSGIGILIAATFLAVIAWRARRLAAGVTTGCAVQAKAAPLPAVAGDAGGVPGSPLAALSSADGHSAMPTVDVQVLPETRTARARQRVRTIRGSAGDAATVIRDEPRSVLVAVTAQAAALACLAIGFGIAAGSFGVPVTITTAMAAYVAGTALSATFPTPAGIGTADAALVGALVMVGAPVSDAVPTVLVFRAVILLAPIVVAGIVAIGWATWRRKVPRSAV
jgi:uncharacterized membrane protein YbhN (UPF0104 family)